MVTATAAATEAVVTPRPRKHRRCACPHRPPGSLVFKPAGTPLKGLERLPIGRDELEAMRLCDGEGLTQQAAGERMGISRGTVQRLVTAGRRKLITAVLGGQALVVAAEPEMPEAPALFAELRRELERRRQDAEFPEWLLPAIAAVADDPERFTGREDLVERLLDQVQSFDPYAGAGCFAESAGLADIEKTLDRLAG